MKVIKAYQDKFGRLYTRKADCLKADKELTEYGSRYCPECCGWGNGVGVGVCNHCKKGTLHVTFSEGK